MEVRCSCLKIRKFYLQQEKTIRVTSAERLLHTNSFKETELLSLEFGVDDVFGGHKKRVESLLCKYMYNGFGVSFPNAKSGNAKSVATRIETKAINPHDITQLSVYY